MAKINKGMICDNIKQEIKNGNFNRAEKYINDYLKTYGEDNKIKLVMGKLYANRDQNPTLLLDLYKNLTTNRKFILYELLNFYHKYGTAEEVLAFEEEVMNLPEVDRPHSLHIITMAYAKLGDHERVIEVCNEVLKELDTKNKSLIDRYVYTKLLAYFSLGRFEDIYLEYGEYTSVNENLMLLIKISRLIANKNENDRDALEELYKLFKKYPDNDLVFGAILEKAIFYSDYDLCRECILKFGNGRYHPITKQYYCMYLINTCQYEEAEKTLLEEINKKDRNSKYFKRTYLSYLINQGRIDVDDIEKELADSELKDFYLMNQVFLYLYHNEPNNAYQKFLLINPNSKEITRSQYNRLWAIFSELNLASNKYQNHGNYYVINQVLDYSYEAFLEHIDAHFIGNDEKMVNTIFKEGLTIEAILACIKDKLEPENLKEIGENLVYVIPYPNCGYLHGHTCNHIEVVLPNDGTKNILTLYPTRKHVPLIEEEFVSKVPKKRLSQIDKFNQKYGL